MNALVLDNVTLHIGGARLFEPISLRVEPGSVTSVVGPSGFGKSSLLAYLCGIQSPVIAGSGSIRIGGDDLSTMPVDKRRLGLLFQDALLFPHLSVGGNLLFGLRSGDSRAARRRRVNDALGSVDLEGLRRSRSGDAFRRTESPCCPAPRIARRATRVAARRAVQRAG